MTCLDSLRDIIDSDESRELNQYNKNADKIKLIELCAQAIDLFLRNNDGVCTLFQIVYDESPCFMIKLEVPYINIEDKKNEFLAVFQVAISVTFEATEDNERIDITLILPGVWDENQYE